MIFSAYSNTFTSPPFLDDFQSFIFEKALNPDCVNASSILSLSRSKFGLTRFLPVITLALNNSLGHSNVIYFHAVNLLIHLLAFFAVFWLMRQVLAAGKKKGTEGPLYELSGFFPLCAAAIWALSPVQTSAVTYLVQRMASMQALFFTLSVACFIKARLLSGKKTRSAMVFYFLCALAAACSYMSKENSVVLPVALALTDIWFFDSAWVKKAWTVCRKTGWKIRTAAVAVLLSFSFCVVTVVLPKLLSGYAQRDFNLVERLLTEGRVVVWYMSLLLWPDPARLSMEHDYQISTSLLSPLTTLPSLFLISALIFLAIKLRRRFPVITYGIAWFFLNLTIESTFIPLELVFEHRLYLPSIGFYLSGAALFTILFRRTAKRLQEAEFAKAACSALLIATACLTLLTFVRNGAWENKITIHEDTVTKAPNSPRANSDYANVLCEVGRYEDAIKYAEKSIELGKKGHENFAMAQNAITIALTQQGETDEALERGEKFIKEKSNGIDADSLPNLCLNLARASATAKKPEDAYKWTLEALRYVQLTDNSVYKKGLVEMSALEIIARFGPQGAGLNHDGAPDSEDLPPALWVAREFNRHGELQYAREIIERAYANNPGEPHLRTEIENLHEEDARNHAQKEKWNIFEKYVRNPFSRFNFDMAVAFLVQEKQLPKLFLDLGERRLDAALQISPDSPEALLLKGWYFYNKDDAQDAVAAVRRVLAGDPENSNAWLALGFFQAKAGDKERAVAAFEKVIELYPGYPKRTIVEELCKQLRHGESIQSASNRE
jgi:tetratricopeptide (TPR) repeat protein